MSIYYQKIHFNNKDYSVSIRKMRRKTISVKLDLCGQIEVKAPWLASRSTILEFIDQNTNWILRQLKKHEDSLVGKFKQDITENRVIFIWGNPCTIDYQFNNGKCVTLDGQKLVVSCKNLSHGKKMVKQWAFDEMYRVTQQQLEQATQSCKNLIDCSNISLSLRKMTRSLGSMSTNNLMKISHNLLHMPLLCLQGIIFHELAHIVHKNHSSSFYSLLDSVFLQRKESDNLIMHYVKVANLCMNSIR